MNWIKISEEAKLDYNADYLFALEKYRHFEYHTGGLLDNGTKTIVLQIEDSDCYRQLTDYAYYCKIEDPK